MEQRHSLPASLYILFLLLPRISFAQIYFSDQKIINQGDTSEPYSVFAIDLDGDGDADVLSASRDDDKIAWYENLGDGSFGSQLVISTIAEGAKSVYATDLDGDGDADVLSASYHDNKIAWYKKLLIETEVSEKDRIIPDDFLLYQNYPNPFNTSTIIHFTLQRSCFITINVYDLRGRLIETLIEGWKDVGAYDILWNAKNLPSGIYIYRLKTEDYVATKKLILQK